MKHLAANVQTLATAPLTPALSRGERESFVPARKQSPDDKQGAAAGNVLPLHEPFRPPPGFGLRQSSGAFGIAGRCKSGRGLPHSKTLARRTSVRGERKVNAGLETGDCNRADSALRIQANAISRLVLACAISLLLDFATASAQTEWLEKLDQSLSIQSPSGLIRSDLSGLLDLELYYIDQKPPGLIFGDDDAFFSPRLSLFLDTQLGPHLYSFVQTRFDRGFDPGSMEDGDIRFDEYFLRYTPFQDSRLNFQFGKFATVVGNWVQRHDSWANPFINAPLPYENVLIITDHVAPAGPAGFLARRNKFDDKRTWIPVIWGPSYASGGSVFGRLEKYEYAVEVKNVALSSRPYAWDARRHPWESPVVSGRLGYRPNAAWSLGASFSHGPYLLPPDEALFPGGPIKDEFKQTTVAYDIAYAWRHWQIWAEAFGSRFEVPNVGDADTLAYYVEGRYKVSPRVFLAGRWNQQFFDKVPDGIGGRQPWDRDIWRIETAVGYRFDRHLQTKLQYSYSRQNGPLQQGEQLVAAQITVKF